MAGLFLFALADFVAITQIMVYVGGVLILMIFAFMLSNKELLKDLQQISGSLFSFPSWQSLTLALAFFGVMVLGIREWNSMELPQWMLNNIQSGDVIAPTDNNIQQLGIKFIDTIRTAFCR